MVLSLELGRLTKRVLLCTWFQKSLKKCKKLLTAWNHDHFGSVLKKIKPLEDRLWRAEVDLVRSGEVDVVNRLKKELNELCAQEKRIWHQRSRVQWLQSGDQNTKFFHGVSTQRKRRNFIKVLRDENGTWQENEEVISGLLIEYYANLFTTSNPRNLERILEGVQPVVTKDMRAALARPFIVEEVECAIKDMAPLKAPGPDGILPYSIKHIGLI
ncbi:uncharacterized protein LOC126722825 [Quercus robur]|uniref:uncharacterized protein LOC126722825 n=1 Tax=Quercus robur TaxID=38942 RepID=UPI002162C011|nr:uncharacterized protein LOC126722825 [Quercus robur]